jgi:sarcosine oxidase, subunit gamma
MAEALLTPLGECARWSLRLPPARAPQLGELAGFRIALDINRAAAVGEHLAARLGPDEWLLCAPAARDLGHEIEEGLSGGAHSLVDVSHRYAGFSLSGEKAAQLLAAGCPLDLHAFGEGSATRTLLAKAEVILWRLGGPTSWRLECARTFAPYVGAFLREAARELANVRSGA